MRCPACGKEIPEVLDTCTTCGWRALDDRGANAGGGRWPETAIPLHRVRDRGEVSAAIWLGVLAAPVWLACLGWAVFALRSPRGGVAILAALAALAVVIVLRLAIEAFVHAHIKTNGVRVSESQYPDLAAAAENFSTRLGIPRPDVYVMQSSAWNTLAQKLAGRRIVVLLSGAIDSVVRGGRREDLAYLLGHEFGHHALGHLDWPQRLLAAGSWFPLVALWHRRRTELSADRVALACTGDIDLATRALVNMTVGSALAAETDVTEAVNQWGQHRDEFFVKFRTLYSLYPHHLWRLAEVRQAAIELDVGRPQAAGPRPCEPAPRVPTSA